MIINSIIVGAGGGFNAQDFLQDFLPARNPVPGLTGIDATKWGIENLYIELPPVSGAGANSPQLANFYGGTNFKTITFKKTSGQFSAITSMFKNMTSLETVNLLQSNGTIATASGSTEAKELFYNCSNLKSANIIINNSSSNFTNAFVGCPKLEDVYFANKSIGANISFADSPLLTNASLVQIANGLKIVTGKTLTLHATAKSNAQALKGTVDANNIFTADANGNVYLSDFITTTKGWTLS